VSVRIRRNGKAVRVPALVPAAARPPDVLTDEETKLNLEAIETFAKAVGGRDALVDVLSIASSAPEVDKVVTLLIDPRYAQLTLRKICYLAGLTVADVFAAYKKALITKAHIHATHIVASRIPPIVEDVMLRATPVPQVCPNCRGGIDERQTCALCRGSGAVLNEPELERQKLALELAHLTERKGGMLIQQNAIANASAASLSAHAPGVLEQLQQVVSEHLFNPNRRRATAPPVVVEGVSDEA